MGNNRQAVKERMSAELDSKIGSVTKTLEQLKLEAHGIHDNAMREKQQVSEAANVILAALMARKEQLFREVDHMSQMLLTTVQDNINETAVNLGNLQSIAANLDSFDAGQLSCIRIPDVKDNSRNLSRQVKVIFYRQEIIQKLGVWGTVQGLTAKNKEEEHDFEMVPDIIELSDEENEAPESQIGKTNSVSSSSNVSRNGDANICSAKVKSSASMDSREAKIGEWLSQLKIKESDTEIKLNFDVRSKHFPYTEKPNKKRSYDDGFCMMDQVSDCKSRNDVTKWLKPRKRPFGSSNQNGQTQNRNTTTKTLEFPCLLLDTKSWVRKGAKKPRNQGDNSIKVVSSAFSPPSHTLPYPFWLKNGCVRK